MDKSTIKLAAIRFIEVDRILEEAQKVRMKKGMTFEDIFLIHQRRDDALIYLFFLVRDGDQEYLKSFLTEEEFSAAQKAIEVCGDDDESEVIFTAKTAGDGWWSKDAKKVGIRKIIITDGNMKVFFTGWDVQKDGLIYTDHAFIEEFKTHLIDIIKGCEYSEQGLQGDNYVDMDI